MLMNPDKQLKDKFFNMYKQDMNDRRLRREEFINTEKMHDKFYMDQITRNNFEEKMRQENHKQKIINDTMNDYGKFMNRKEEERKNKYLKNYEMPMENYNINSSHSMGNLNQFDLYNNSVSPSANMNPDMTLINEKKAKKDSLNHILYPEYIGPRKLNEMERNNKNEFQKFYKHMLDSQMNYRSNSPEIALMQHKDINRFDGNVNMVSNPCKDFFFLKNFFLKILFA